MKRTVVVAGVGLLVGLCAARGLAQEKSPLVHQTFEAGVSGWMTVGSGSVEVAPLADNPKVAKASLQYSYELEKGKLSLLLLPVEAGKIAKAKRFHFWIKSDYNAPLTLTLGEGNGARYTATLMAKKDDWQEVDLGPTDFHISANKDDPTDPNGKLDMDQVENIGFTDFGNLFAQAEGPVADLLGVKLGKHKLQIADFRVSEEVSAGQADEDVLDRFSRPQVGWLIVGSATGRNVSEKPVDGKSMRVDYTQKTMKIVGLIRSLPAGRLMNRKTLEFEAASKHPTRMIVQVEEKSGGQYNIIFDIPGGSVAKKFSFKFAEFAAADDSMDDNGKLDLPLVKTVLFLDFTGLAGMVDQENSLWIGNLSTTGK